MWHARLGHLNFEALKNLSKVAIGLPKIKHPKQMCDTCVLAKQTRSQFPKESRYITSKPLELIYANVCGKIAPKTHGGNEYFLLVVDGFSRFMWIFTMKTKDEVAGLLVGFIRKSKTRREEN